VATYRYVLCDVFTDRALEGNQLAVFTDARDLDAETMQALALETKLSESVFVLPPEQGGHARIRIFTPTKELQFAGHPTLGSAFVLGGPLQLLEIRLETGAGIVPVRLEREGARIVFGRMEQPLPTWVPFRDTAELFAALGVEGAEAPVEVYDNGIRHSYVVLGSREQVAGLRPDFPRLAAITETDCVSCFAGDGGEWKTRMFAPNSGVDEDPATGSAAGPLAVHLARHGRIGFGDEIRIEQGAEIGRPSVLFARVDGSGDDVERVEVGGSAVVVARGEFRL
jgi:trans-2,3-dihydro-3-hydroxyanthranilate isomerase